MALNFRKFIEGLRIVPKAASTASEKGDLDVVSGSGKLNYHNGTTASPIVTEAHSATLTNKTIDGDDNTIQDVGIASLKTVLADADKVIRRDAAGAVASGNSLPNSSQIVTLDSSDTLSNKILNTLRTVKSTPTNTAGALALPSTGYALVSANINTIAASSDGQVIIITNTSASAITIANEFSATGDGIRTGSGGSIFLAAKASLVLVYNSTAPGYWYVVGGVGGSSTFSSVGSNAAVVAYNAVYLDSSSLAQKLDATTDSKVEFVGVSLDAGGGSVRVQVAGEVDIPVALIEGGSFTIGKPVYASVSNPGKYQSSVPSIAGQWVIAVGIATTTTKMAINGAGSSTAVKLTSQSDPIGTFVDIITTGTKTYTTANFSPYSQILCIVNAPNTPVVINLPNSSTVPNVIVRVKFISTTTAGGTVAGAYIYPQGSDTIDGVALFSGINQTVLSTKYESITLIATQSNGWFII